MHEFSNNLTMHTHRKPRQEPEYGAKAGCKHTWKYARQGGNVKAATPLSHSGKTAKKGLHNNNSKRNRKNG